MRRLDLLIFNIFKVRSENLVVFCGVKVLAYLIFSTQNVCLHASSSCAAAFGQPTSKQMRAYVCG